MPTVSRRTVKASEGLADTLGITVTTAAPSAAANAGFLTVVSGAVYKVRVTTALTGTAETQLNNLVFRQNAVVIGSIPAISGQVVYSEFPRVTTTGTNITVTVTANATAGSIYTVHIAATRVE